MATFRQAESCFSINVKNTQTSDDINWNLNNGLQLLASALHGMQRDIDEIKRTVDRLEGQIRRLE